MMVLSSLPVFMGYAYDSFEKVPNRCLFTIDFTSYATILLLAFTFGMYLQQWGNVEITRKINVAVILVLTLFVIMYYKDIFLVNARYDIIDQTNHNNINYYRTRVQETVDMIRNSPEADVVVPFLPDAPPAILSFEIANDPTVWINEAMAAYFHKNSVVAQ